MTHWFAPKELATKLSIWNTSHSIGAGLVVVLCGWLIVTFGGVMEHPWRLCFFVPAGLAILGAVMVAVLVRDTPESMGLPPVEEYRGEVEPGKSELAEDFDFRAFVKKHVFLNKWIWLVALSNFFVYVVRYAIFDWGPTFLTETRGVNLMSATWMTSGFEMAGIAGTIIGGVLTDRVFGGYGTRACAVYMAMCSLALFLFWQLPFQSVPITSR